jgi:hypothetical protein
MLIRGGIVKPLLAHITKKVQVIGRLVEDRNAVWAIMYP